LKSEILDLRREELAFGWEFSFEPHQLTGSDAPPFIHVEDDDGGAANGSQAMDFGSPPAKVLLPRIFAGIEQSREAACCWIVTGDVRPLGEAATRAGKCQVVERGYSAMFDGHNMINVKCKQLKFLL
jgi:hypothetical protein